MDGKPGGLPNIPLGFLLAGFISIYLCLYLTVHSVPVLELLAFIAVPRRPIA